MPRYRFDILAAQGVVMATHEIEYDDDRSAIKAAHLINSPSPIGCGFRVWCGERLIHCHNNEPPNSD